MDNEPFGEDLQQNKPGAWYYTGFALFISLSIILAGWALGVLASTSLSI